MVTSSTSFLFNQLNASLTPTTSAILESNTPSCLPPIADKNPPFSFRSTTPI
ncbi:hypothetical protein Scep_002083 [Stephania cephalantha]|uniref:Uncharacterized protein n=1 Tax=Stephania cephalantha TaxID=152367 RepID=A0AAP0LAR9_9MAGN